MPPGQPGFNSYYRDGAVGLCNVYGVTPGDTVHVHALATLSGGNIIEVGSAVSVDLSSTDVVLDFALFYTSIFGIPIPMPEAVFCISSNPAGEYGPISIDATAGLLDFAWQGTASISAVRTSPTTADVTIAGVSADATCMIFWIVSVSPGLGFAGVVGPGTFPITGLDPLLEFNPTMIGVSDKLDGMTFTGARIQAITGIGVPLIVTSRPHSYVKKAPHSREVP